MTETFRLTLAQLNPVLGDLAGNAARARAAWAAAREAGAQMLALTEMFITGYQTQDLILKPAFAEAAEAVIADLAAACADGPAIGIGGPHRAGGRLYNGYHILQGGKVTAVVLKHHLPNDGVFDEKRVFTPADVHGPYRIGPLRIGTPICEDSWHPDVCETLAETGAEILLVPNGSPYRRGVQDERMNVAVARVAESGLSLVYLNQVGGQDELVFDGASFGINTGGALAFQFPAFSEALRLIEIERVSGDWRVRDGEKTLIEEGDEADYRACMLGLRDYVEKNRFPGVVLGLSGGIDSALCAALAADALGPERVHAVMLPYRYTSQDSLTDAKACAAALGIRYDVLPIFEAVDGLEAAVKPLFVGKPRDVTEENIQSRARGTILMAISNKTGAMVVTTGNKSEMSVGYATLYGDMNGGFNPIKDLYKMEVYRLSALRNAWRPSDAWAPGGIVIPPNILQKPPTAELRENQKDQDSLPPYEVLDDILACLVEHEMHVAEIIARGHDKAVVERIEHLLAIAEYKRRQSAPGVKVTVKNFGRDRRYPIVNRFRDRAPGPYKPDPALQPEVSKGMGDAFDG
jgi:NAD+ synthase